ncbi:MAG: aconitase X [Bosea sp. (in: a-proteobacteria)]
MNILNAEEQAIAARQDASGMAMRIVAETARLMGAERLIPVASAHIDGALYHGDSGTLFAEALVAGGAKLAVRATLNVGALDLHGCAKVRLPAHERDMAKRMMRAYETMGCQPTWTCAPYQAGHRPAVGSDVAWGESNAVVFCNSVLGARTNRYGDFLDIACAIAGRAPDYGLHRPENRKATLILDVDRLPQALRKADVFYPVIGTLLGQLAGTSIAVIDGLQGCTNEDRLKALGAAAASAGGVGLFHIAGVTPEAALLADVVAEPSKTRTVAVTAQMIGAARARLSTVSGNRIDAIAIGSPHLSLDEIDALEQLMAGRKLVTPLYANTGRHVIRALEADGRRTQLEALGVHFVIDTCVVVTPILPDLAGGVLMTNSGKFAQYAPGNTGYGVIYGSLAECVESAVAGRFMPGEDLFPALADAATVWQSPVTAIASNTAAEKARHRPATSLKAQVLLDGEAKPSPVLALTSPISFWGGVDPRTGDIIDARHPQCGENIAGKFLVLPGTIGSSSASAVLLELVHAGRAPAAIAMAEPDAILLLGLVVAREMGWPTPPACRLVKTDQEGLQGRKAALDKTGLIRLT